MTYNACWYKAFSVSCVLHLVMALLLAVLIKDIDFRPPPEQYITVELAEIAANPISEQTALSDTLPVNHTSPIAAHSDQVMVRTAASSPITSPRARQTLAGGESSTITIPAGSTSGGSGQTTAAQPAAGQGGPSAASGGKPASGRDIDGIINAFLSRVEKSKDYPYMARKRGQVGTVTVAVRLTEAGELAGAQVVRSSGVATLDEAALALVRRVCPFSHNAGKAIAMNIPIAYNLN